MIKKICENCKKEFKATQNKSRFCSLPCYHESYGNFKICPVCKEKFRAKKLNQKHCSFACRTKFSGNIEKICNHCGKKFTILARKNRQKYCSKACARSSSRLKNKKCPCCNEIKDRKEFRSRNRNGKYRQLSQYCKLCENKRLYIKTPEKYIRDLYRGLNKRKKEKKQEINFSVDFLLSLYEKQKGKCALSGISMTHVVGGTRQTIKYNISIDRIDSSGWYTINNIQLVALCFNGMKSDYTVDQFLELCKTIVDYNKNYYEVKNLLKCN